MKKIFLGIIAMLCFIACEKPDVKNDVDFNDEENNVFWNTYEGRLDEGIITKKYKGHSYIFFKEGSRMGVVHNPDCQCHFSDSVEVKDIENNCNHE